MPHEDHLTAIALGELHEPAGIVAVRRVETLGQYDADRKRYAVVVMHHVERITVLPRSGEFGQLVEVVRPSLFGLGPKVNSRRVTLVDVTTAGRAALEPLTKAGVKATPIAVTSGIGSRGSWGAVHIGEPELAIRLAIVLDEDRLRVDPALANADALAAQLEKFSTGRPERPSSAMAAFHKPERQELVRALSLACWWSDRQMVPRIAQPIPPDTIDYEELTRPPTFDEVIKYYGRRG